jgi:solute:Na+ symporter, SSS family
MKTIHTITLALAALILLAFPSPGRAQAEYLKWERLPELPSAAAVSGVDQRPPLVAGDGLQAEGGFIAVNYGANCQLFFNGLSLPGPGGDAPTPGGNQIFSLNKITRAWARAGAAPAGCGTVTAAKKWRNDVIVMCGDTAGPTVWKASAVNRSPFGTANWIVLGGYLAAMVGLGFLFAGREKTTADYFKSGQRTPWWAAGLSIFGTGLSSITFMSVPAKTYATDLTYFPTSIAQFLAVPIVIALFIPVYRRLRITTSYEYLEMRFNLPARILGGIMFLIFQFGRFSIVLYLPSIALAMVTGVNIQLSILLMGVLTIIYTWVGGIEAVIWTDVVQVVVFMGGVGLCVALMVMHIDGGVAELGRVALADGKLHMFDLAPTLATPTLWVALLGGAAYTLIYAGTDQTYVQRYTVTKTEKDAAAGLWTFAFMLIPAAIFFYGVGTVLYVFYKAHPEALDPTLESNDALFLWYIVTKLPTGGAGLLIAGLFAAAMSSLSSSMNSAAAVITSDFYRRLRPDAPDAMRLRLAKIVTLIFGVAGTGMALLMSTWEIASLWDEFLELIGLVMGGLGGMFLLGIVSRRATGNGAIVGLVGGLALQVLIKEYLPIHLMMYTFTGMLSSMLIGWIASLILPGKAKTGATIYDMRRRTDN